MKLNENNTNVMINTSKDMCELEIGCKVLQVECKTEKTNTKLFANLKRFFYQAQFLKISVTPFC